MKRLLKNLMNLALVGLGILPGLALAHSPLGESATLVTPLPVRDQGFDDLRLGFTQEAFLNRSKPPAGVADYSRFSALFRASSREKSLSSAIEIGGSFASNVERETMVEVPEAFVAWTSRPESGLSLALGRKREKWSALDSDWTLGLFQPFNRFDGLRPTEQGLAGAFIGWRGEKFRSMVFVSPLYMPEQGPRFEVQEGKFESGNAWFSRPVDNLILMGRATETRYHVETPAVGSVINHPGVGAILAYGDQKPTGLLMQMSLARKPSNKIAVPFTAHNSASADRDPYASITVYPAVVYHSIASVDLAQRFQAGSLSVSALHEIPDAPAFPRELNAQKLEPMTMLSPSVEIRPSQAWNSRFKLSYLHTFGGETSVMGPDASSKSNPFGYRTMFRQAVSVEQRTRLGSIRRWSIDQGLRWIEELSDQGSVAMIDLLFSSPNNWRVGIYADVLESRQPTDRNPGFISRFRGNDRFGAQLTYIF